MWKLAIIFWLVSGSQLLAEDVVITNETGIPIARIQIDDRVYEGDAAPNTGHRILVHVTPGKHRLKLVFRGGGYVDWPHFEFQEAREIFIERAQNQISARVE